MTVEMRPAALGEHTSIAVFSRGMLRRNMLRRFRKMLQRPGVHYNDETCSAPAGTCNPDTEKTCDGACIDKADACTCRGSNVLCDNTCIGALDKCCNDGNGEYGCSMVETCCNGVCCGLNHECCDGKCVSSMGPHSCSEESDDDPGKSAMFRLNNRRSLSLQHFLGGTGFLAFALTKEEQKTRLSKGEWCAAAALFVQRVVDEPRPAGVCKVNPCRPQP